MRLLLDTNVLIDLVANREPFAADARRLCVASVFGDVQLWVTTQSFADAYYVLRRSASEQEVKRALLGSLDRLLACSTSPSDLRPALESNWPDIEDYLVAHATKRVNADLFVTRDTELASRCAMPVATPRQTLDLLRDEKGLVYEDVEF